MLEAMRGRSIRSLALSKSKEWSPKSLSKSKHSWPIPNNCWPEVDNKKYYLMISYRNIKGSYKNKFIKLKQLVGLRGF